ncbi:hypothetical protein IFM89_016967 [Coptis chinensis]|uniref:Uncharacterized protein n=1 Tax=Coptis chinensis TaxID=261450 RepID=A0A835HR08_9MAGN|nr:hypothetical protein IFM89_016967 [Coptis chinensis]
MKIKNPSLTISQVRARHRAQGKHCFVTVVQVVV